MKITYIGYKPYKTIRVNLNVHNIIEDIDNILDQIEAMSKGWA